VGRLPTVMLAPCDEKAEPLSISPHSVTLRLPTVRKISPGGPSNRLPLKMPLELRHSEDPARRARPSRHDAILRRERAEELLKIVAPVIAVSGPRQRHPQMSRRHRRTARWTRSSRGVIVNEGAL